MEKISEVLVPNQSLHSLEHALAQKDLSIDSNSDTASTIQSPKHLLIKTKDGKTVSPPVEALLLLVLIEKTNYIEAEGRKIATDVEGTCKKMKLLDKLYKDALEMSDKDGSLDWKKKGLGPSLETARNEGFVLPAKEGKLAREERDALLRSITQQRDDLSTQASQFNTKLNRCNTLRDDHYRQVVTLLSSMNESCKKILRNVG